MRKCTTCGVLKPEEEYYQSRKHYSCKDCMKAESRKYYYDNHTKRRESCNKSGAKYREAGKDKLVRYIWKDTLLQYAGGKCSKCGYDKCNAALDFHHVDDLTKDFSVGSIRGIKDFVKATKEIEKCVLLCATCHREVHYLENEQKSKALLLEKAGKKSRDSILQKVDQALGLHK